LQMSGSKSDRIEKQTLLRAPQSRVWRALTDAEEFGAWFRVKFEGHFVRGERIQGGITQPGYEHVTLEIIVEAIEPETLFSFRWHPYAVDANQSYASEPTTLVEFRLEPVAGGTRLTVVESGFDRVPASRRDEAFLRNSEGWAIQMVNIERHVAG
jgi:uncharacterized protein YndB with AHSA1/START domain